MACSLTSGYSIDCRESIGGLKKVLIANFTNVNQSTPFTFTAGVITGISMVGAAKFWPFEQVKETSSFSEALMPY